ncbi:MAG: sigma-54-dependent Fis family transcriptional regulator [Acidobacteria bacterium]|nr:sigma-54-dependent Fis family transcriptional regulator [Acidobacteriota bacterium]
MNLLIVDDEQSMRELLEIVFREEGYGVLTASSLESAYEAVRKNDVDIVVSDLKLSDGTGMDLLQTLREEKPEILFILITAYASADSAIDALKYGAFDYVTKPFDVEELKGIVHNAVERSVQVQSSPHLPPGENAPPRIVGISPAMLKIYKTIGVVAPTDSTILLTGESGTGKEMIARVIHDSSPRKGFSFVSINCGSLPETLLESELFGYMKGAFTGAFANKKGLFEEAHRGTLLLDEIAETSLAMQVKLLRAIQEKRIRRLGSTEEIPVDVRIIAATNKDLAGQIRKGAFREDLYYRIAVIPIHLPPIRERREDIPQLANYFLQRFSRKLSKDLKGFERAAMEKLMAHEWKGNVRELENVVERAVALETTDMIQLERLPEEVVLSGRVSMEEFIPQSELPEEGLNIDHYLEAIERRLILKALERTGGVQIKAAKVLQISYRSFIHRMHKLGINLP